MLRYLLEDIEDRAAQVGRAVESGAEVTLEVLAECVYVLQGVYAVPRSDIAESIEVLLEEVYCARKRVAATALGLYRGSTFDFVDCVLAAEHAVNGQDVLTFDKKSCSLISLVG